MSTETHVLPVRVYFAVFGALLLLTGLTTWVAYHDFGRWNIYLALTIAVAKALLVVLYFMHMRYSPKLLWVFACAAVLWLLILFALTMADYDTRPLVEAWPS